MKNANFTLSIFVSFAISLISCGTNKKGTSSGVKVAFAKTTNLLDSTTETDLLDTTGYVASGDLATLQLKPIAVRIGPTNEGGYMIWGAKNCAGAPGKTKIDKKEFTYASEHVCTSNADNEYLDLLDIDALNNTLNSQSWPVPPGTYHYVSVIMCGPDETGTANNIKFKAGAMTADHEARACNPFTGYTESGIVVPEGGALTVKLTYDLNQLIDYLILGDGATAQTPGGHGEWGCYWTQDGMTQYCPKFGVSALTPSIAE